jgi:hypothetical protein
MQSEALINLLSKQWRANSSTTFAYALRMALGHDDLKQLHREISRHVVKNDPQLTQQLYDLLASLPNE